MVRRARLLVAGRLGACGDLTMIGTAQDGARGRAAGCEEQGALCDKDCLGSWRWAGLWAGAVYRAVNGLSAGLGSFGPRGPVGRLGPTATVWRWWMVAEACRELVGSGEGSEGASL